jgi:protein-L-isoaspartate O-methyltransferase
METAILSPAISIDRMTLGPNEETLVKIADYLETSYRIVPVIESDEYWDLFYAAVPSSFSMLYDKRAFLLKNGHKRAFLALNDAFYDGMAVQPALGFVHSTQYNGIFDTIALTTALVELTGARRVLDIGCNSGYVANWLSTHCGCDVVGFDPSEKSIETARSISAAVGNTAEFLSGMAHTVELDGKFDIIVAAKTTINMYKNSGAWRVWLSEHLNEGGLFIYIDEAASQELSCSIDLNLSDDFPVVFADNTGGFDFNRYVSELCLVFQHRVISPVSPEEKVDEMCDWWGDRFQVVMNNPATQKPFGQRNQAWSRVWARQQTS